MSMITLIMLGYIAEGCIALLFNVPLLIVATFNNNYKKEREFVVIGLISIVDALYGANYIWSSISRLLEEEKQVTRISCINSVPYFLNMITGQLIFFIPALVTFDRWFITCYTSKHTASGNRILKILGGVLVGIALGMAVANKRYFEEEGMHLVSSKCYSSNIIKPSLKLYFHILKWILHILFTAIYIAVFRIWEDQSFLYPDAGMQQPAVKALNKLLQWPVLTSFFLQLIPDIIIFLDFKIPVYVRFLLYSCFLLKPIVNCIIFIIKHKQTRQIYNCFIGRTGGNILVLTYNAIARVTEIPRETA